MSAEDEVIWTFAWDAKWLGLSPSQHNLKYSLQVVFSQSFNQNSQTPYIVA